MGRHFKDRRARDKIVDQKRASAVVEAARRRGEKIVFTNGCFDVVHGGHVRSLEEARALGDLLIVAVNGDKSVARLKGRGRPALPARTRMEVLAAFACVDWVVPFDSDTPLRLIQSLRPDVLAKGGDWASAEIVGADLVKAAGGRVVRLKLHAGPRSSDLLERIRR